MIRLNRKSASSQKGVAIIEAALTLPLVLLVLFGVINFGVALYNKSVITNASREAARNGIVFSSTVDYDAIAQDAINRCTGRLINFGGSTTCTAEAEPVSSINAVDPTKMDNTLIVRVNFDFNTVAGALMGVGNVISMESETQMKFEI